MRFCPNCNSAVYDDRAELCPECGRPMNQNVCPSCGRPLAPGEKCPHCDDCRAHGEMSAARSRGPEQGSRDLSMWAYMGLLLLAMVPVVGFIFMVVWACGAGSNPQLTKFARGVLLAKVVLFLLGLIFFGIAVAAMQPLLDELDYWLNDYGYYEDYGSYDFDNFDDFYNYDFGDDYSGEDLFGDDWPDFYGEAPAADAA